MPPKKRKASASTAGSSTQATKKVRIGDTSTIDDDESRTSTPSGRSRRSTANDAPQYKLTRTNNTSSIPAKPSRSNSRAATATASPPPAPEVKKRGRGRPPKKPQAKAQAENSSGTQRGILKNGTAGANDKASGGSTASAAKKRSSATARSASPPAKKKAAAIGGKRGRPRKRQATGSPEAEVRDTMAVDVDDQVNGIDEAVNEDVQYWLMKAEPDSRIEKGRDVKFSIDDLAACVEPEAWDGVRNPSARNNMRAMRIGDLAFFYHSNTKTPGVAGVMRIVEEHGVDESAFDPDHPYYDPKSDRANPKWECVKVEFVKKFDGLVTLRELKKFAEKGGALEGMQMLRQGRLSVSSVQPAEWRFVLDLADQPHSLGHPVKADGYESDTDGETEGEAAGVVEEERTRDKYSEQAGLNVSDDELPTHEEEHEEEDFREYPPEQKANKEVSEFAV